jgi:hypothetical protein
MKVAKAEGRLSGKAAKAEAELSQTPVQAARLRQVHVSRVRQTVRQASLQPNAVADERRRCEDLTVAGCDCPEGHLDPLGTAAELSFPWAGVLVLGADYELFGEFGTGLYWHEYGGPLHEFHHGIVHFVQALGSPFLHNHGLRILRAAHDVVDAPWNGHESFVTEVGRLRRRNSSGLSCEDLLESAAEVEASRLMSASGGGGQPVQLAMAYRANLTHAYSDPDAPQRRGFDYLAERIGDESAYELLALLTFLAFIHDEPCEAFEYLAPVAGQAPEAFRSMSAAQHLDRLEWADGYEQYWDSVAAGEPLGTPYVVEPLREAMRRLGRSALLETIARPGVHLLKLTDDQLRAVEPPVIVFPSREGGLVHHRNGVALGIDPRFTAEALIDVGLYGAAERLTVDRRATEPVYCNHTRCPHRTTGLCRRWYLPPSTADGHNACPFVRRFTDHAASDPAATWAKMS